ncbi:Uncharacterised protein [Streptococcus pneumoniae]|nr:Uncharacterised protein [Streptococcus pneumoniae]
MIPWYIASSDSVSGVNFNLSCACFLIISSFVFSIKKRKMRGFCILEIINSTMSGCQSASMIIWAPRRDPPCSTRCVSLAISSNHETEPDDLPFTPRASVLRGRRVEPFVPTPPPRLMISITCLRCSEIPSRESFT